jgi:hypothetical protein
MKICLFALMTCAIISTPLMAAEKPALPKKTTSATTSSSVDISNGTDVIGSQDAPLVLNVVSWKDKESYLPKNPLAASMLQEGLEPIDRDVIHREVDFSRALQDSAFPSTKP